MDLKTYLKEQPRGRAAALAGALGISTVYLAQLSARQDGRVAGPELAMQIEKETGGAVRAWDSRPDDWHRIWPMLTDTDGAPPVPAADAAEHGVAKAT